MSISRTKGLILWSVVSVFTYVTKVTLRARAKWVSFADTSLAWIGFEMGRARWTCLRHVVGNCSGVC